jgi:tetratricopeptide (TPR) repeat protein
VTDKRVGEHGHVVAAANEVSGWVGGSTMQVGVVHGDIQLQGGPRGLLVPRQLPAVVPHFVGRRAELNALTMLLEQSTGEARNVVISAIAGSAGIGKTALAVYWAHQVADRFPDGQLYVNLRGFDPSGLAVTSADAVRIFLDAFAVPAERIPISLEAQAALYRSILAGRKVLVVLDNARDVDQIRPLIPGSPGCLVVVTSRNQLSSLITAQGAYPLTVDQLTDTEARELLTRRLGSARVQAESGAVERIAASCARLPLALSIVAARAVAHPRFGLAALADELSDARSQLDVFDGGDPDTNVRVAFSWSYHQLSSAAARMFRLLGLHPGPDISVRAAASLSGSSAERVRPLLAELARAHLVAEHSPGRFTFHDLLRSYASDLAVAVDGEDDRQRAVERILDHYLHTAHTGARLLGPRVGPITMSAPCPGVTSEEPSDYQAAWAWFDSEYAVLLKIVQLAADTRHSSHAWQIPWAMDEFFNRRGHWHDRAATQYTAVTITQQGADHCGQAHAHRSLGRAYSWLGRFDLARTHLLQALRLFDELGDQIGQADSHLMLGAVFDQRGEPAQALPHAQRALDLSIAAEYRLGQGMALNNVGWYQALLGNPQEALILCEKSLVIKQEIGDRRGEANTLDSIGYAHYCLGNHQEALGYYSQAIARHREFDERQGQATILAHFGDAHHAIGDFNAARDAWQQALDILDLIGVSLGAGLSVGFPHPDQIRSKLHHIHPQEPHQ